MLRRMFALPVLFLAWGILPAQAVSTTALDPLPEHKVSTALITQFIERFHYKQTQLDNKQSEAIFDHYLENLDPNRSFLTQKDIDTFKNLRTKLDDALANGDVEPAFRIFSLFNQRRIERAKYAITLLDKKFNFTIDENFTFDRSEAPWAKDEKELDDIWRKRVKNDVLNLSLAKKTDEELKKTLRKRYQRIITQSEQLTAEDTYEVFINTYLSSVEPHTGYFSPRTSENFNINMSLSLEGIGAALQTVEEHTVVQRIITGGPADLGGQLHADDKIIGVSQGLDGEMEDVIGWRLSDVVDLIRGPKDSVVRLQILPRQSGQDGPTKEITIVRNKVKLEEQQAKKSIIEIPDGDKKAKIGIIKIPMFYMDFAGYSQGDKNYRSTTRDTKTLIEELQAEHVDGIVIDLRNNGGGSLVEAVSLTGLFIKTGPVVQIRERSGKLELNEDTDPEIAYTGPMAVLVNGFSASASEIFAGAIQDYGRGTILGETTYGKGTVQSVVDLNGYVNKPDMNLGKLKLTMAQFFRINGDSTQHRGVIPDIVFPNADKIRDQGEDSLENALPWANISSAKYTPYKLTDINLDEIKKHHQQRVSSDNGFEYLVSQVSERRKIMDKKQVSLHKGKRKTEREAMEQAQRERLNRFRVSRGMEPLKKLDTEEENSNERDEKMVTELENIELRESANVLVEIIHAQESKLAYKTSGLR